jgi:hypothetical protein
VSYVIQHLSLTPTSWYGGPLARWVTSLGSAVTYNTQADAQAVIDLYRMYAYPAVNPPGQFTIVSTPASVISGDVVAYADTTGGSFVDSTRQPGTVRQVSVIGPGSGTYTPVRTSGVLVSEVVGGGGGGGGVASPTGTNVGIGGSGGGGGYAKKFYLIPNQTFTYSVGAKGTGGAAGANNGTAGANTTFTGSLAGTITGGGGGNGNGDAGGAAPVYRANLNGGTATGGDVNRPGGSGAGGNSQVQPTAYSPWGGSSFYSAGARPAGGAAANLSNAGNNADGFGGGGSGAAAHGTGASAAGGNGSDGVLIVTEYE